MWLYSSVSTTYILMTHMYFDIVLYIRKQVYQGYGSWICYTCHTETFLSTFDIFSSLQFKKRHVIDGVVMYCMIIVISSCSVMLAWKITISRLHTSLSCSVAKTKNHVFYIHIQLLLLFVKILPRSWTSCSMCRPHNSCVCHIQIWLVECCSFWKSCLEAELVLVCAEFSCWLSYSYP